MVENGVMAVNYGTSLVYRQLSPAVMKRSHKVKVTKKDVYLSDDNLADGKANRKERESKN